MAADRAARPTTALLLPLVRDAPAPQPYTALSVAPERAGMEPAIKLLFMSQLEAAPVGPVLPAPVGPVNPRAPVGPVGPVKPVAPVVPVAPVGPNPPVGPVNPVEPVAPVAPVGPIKDTVGEPHVPPVFGPYKSPVDVSK